LFIQHNSTFFLLSLVVLSSWTLTQLECGLGPEFLQQPFCSVRNIVTRGWIVCLWEFLYDYRIKQSPGRSQRIQRFEGDEYIMFRILQLNYAQYTLRAVNYCRLYLQVELLSDIVNVSGLRVTTNAWKWQFHPIRHKTRKWPRQPRPPESMWVLWRKALCAAFAITETG
jgi:hypothetical protein